MRRTSAGRMRLAAGRGRFAMLAKCGQSISVTLHLTLQVAREAKSHADRCGCGDADCKAADSPRAFRYQFARHRHLIVDLAEPSRRHVTKHSMASESLRAPSRHS